jgi:Tfp pilus assembly protein PilE
VGARQQGAFTRIKLFVAIAIIAVLMTILMPSLQGGERQTRAVCCMSNLRQWGLRCYFYAEDSGRQFNRGSYNGHDAAHDGPSWTRPCQDD